MPNAKEIMATQAIKLGRDEDTFVLDNADKKSSCVMEAGHTEYNVRHSQSVVGLIEIRVLKEPYPARFEVCKLIINHQPNAKLPRGIKKLVKTTKVKLIGELLPAQASRIWIW